MRTGKTVEKLPPERLRHWQGERLQSQDLNDQLTYEAEARWWHNRAMHNAYGVAHGLGLSTTPAGTQLMAILAALGILGGYSVGQVVVAPGVAYDVGGREMTLNRSRIVEPAAGSGPYVLVLRAGEAAEQLLWIPRTELSVKSGVPLAWGRRLPLPIPLPVPLPGVFPDGSIFAWGPYPAQPRSRPLSRPTLGHGSTVIGRTPWRQWTGVRDLDRGIEVSINTAAAGFSDVPCYFAWLQGGSAGLSRLTYIGRVVEATAEGFTFSLWQVHSFLSGTHSIVDFVGEARRRLSVCWLGVEMRPTGSDTLHEVHHGNF